MSAVRPPWEMDGFCVMIFYLASARRMSSFVPSPLEVSHILPGTTLGGLYAASYQSGAFGALNELSVFPALARYKRKKGFFVPCSMVESREGFYGHRGAWGLKNERASFQWSDEKSRYVLKVQAGGEKILEVHLSTRKISLPLRLSIPFFYVRGNGVVSYHADYAARVYLSSSAVEIPENSPLTAYGFKRKLITTIWKSTKIVVHPPESEKVVIPKGVSEGVFQVPQKPFEPCGVSKSVRECSLSEYGNS